MIEAKSKQDLQIQSLAEENFQMNKNLKAQTAKMQGMEKDHSKLISQKDAEIAKAKAEAAENLKNQTDTPAEGQKGAKEEEKTESDEAPGAQNLTKQQALLIK